MGDSEDEYDRKRRDKFRGERTESYRGSESSRRSGGDDRRRDEWIDRESWSGRNRPRQDYRDYRGSGGGRERYSPPRQHDISPPLKRMRHEWRGGYSGGHESITGGAYGSGWQPSFNNSHAPFGTAGPDQRDSPMETQPPMQSFKQYLQTQDDNITDDEAIRKYNEYKLEFKRFQLNEFFVTHKDEEWFKIKYHPEEAVKRKEEQMQALKKRVDVFLEFLNVGRLDKLSVDNDQSEQLVRLLDAVVIRLEGGTDFDLQVLDEQPKTSSPPAASAKAEEGSSNEPAETGLPSPKKESEKSTEEDSEKPSNDVSMEKIDETSQGGESDVPKAKKRKREYDSEVDSGSESGDEQESERPSVPPDTNGVDGEEKDSASVASPESKKGETEVKESRKDDDDDEPKDEKDANGSEKGSEREGEAMETEKDEPKLTDETAEKDDAKSQADDDDKDVVEVKDDSSKKGEDGEAKPRPLHRTASIFLRNLAPTITKQEVEAMCKRYPGFLRVAIADPQPDRRWFRRGWVTFERNVNIKEICWNLNNIRLRDCELGAIVNRDLSRRIRTVSGITSHKQVVRHDIKLTAKIVHNLDAKSGLWQESTNAQSGDKGEGDSQTTATSTTTFGLVSKNPVLKNITDYLIEEASAEEEELLGQSADQEEGQLGEDSATIERDDSLIKVLDRLLLYLRIVHSVDYYNHCEYPNEDEMPNRCGIMHARGTPPSTKVTQQEVTDYCRMFEQKIASFLQPACKVSEEEFAKLGAKQPDIEVEKFVQSNTQEIAKDKYLCPLSGKKFKGPEFVRKHIFNKHGEKVDEVKKEVEYFNNYLKDPKRPQLPEHPQNRQDRKTPTEGSSRDSFSAPHVPYPTHYQMNYGGPRPGNYHSYGGAGSYGAYHSGGYNSGYSRGSRGGYSRGRGGGGGGGGDFRPVIHYRDLDAPREHDEFI